MGDNWAYQLGSGAKYVGGGIGLYWLYRILTFTFNFLAGRYDARQERLEEREARVGKSLANRLDHLELQGEKDRTRISVLEECVAVLANEVRQVDPANLKLGQVARMLRGVHPVMPPDPNLEELMRHAGRALDEGDGA